MSIPWKLNVSLYLSMALLQVLCQNNIQMADHVPYYSIHLQLDIYSDVNCTIMLRKKYVWLLNAVWFSINSGVLKTDPGGLSECVSAVSDYQPGSLNTVKRALLLTLVSAIGAYICPPSSQIYYSATGFQMKLCYVRPSADTLSGTEAIWMYVLCHSITPGEKKKPAKIIWKHDAGCSVGLKCNAKDFGVILWKVLTSRPTS